MKKIFLMAFCLFSFSLIFNIKSDGVTFIESAKAFGPCCEYEEKSICGLDGENYDDHYLSKEMVINEISF